MDRLQPLLRRLSSALNTDPRAQAAMRLSHPQAGRWTVRRGVLTAQAGSPAQLAAGVPGSTVRLSLASPATIGSVASALSAAGWTVENLDGALTGAGAAALIEGTFDAPGPLLIHRSLLWAFMDGVALELDAAADAAARIGNALVPATADAPWLDVLGEYYAVPRGAGESDAAYRARIVPEVLRPKSNNRAMAAILSEAAGQPGATVTDVTIYRAPVPAYDGQIVHDGTYQHNASSLPIYGLFDVSVPFDLLGDGNEAQFRARVTALIDRLRAAGTHVREMTVTRGRIVDEAPGPGLETFASTVNPNLSDGPAGPFLDGIVLAPQTTILDFGLSPTDADLILTVTTAPPAGTLALTGGGGVRLEGGGFLALQGG